ncbi:MAG: rod shape-determining protein MreC [Alphaproteobacteria bacterium]|nr:rod shape-determining protein MreC [Alphaproteobacteria bacterium]PHX99545.1 MAG: rod shape-determining protein MreC [Rhodospirillaceae bacterium]
MRQTTGQITRLGSLKTLLQRFAFLSLIALTFALMLIGKADTVFVERTRIAITDAVMPIFRILSQPANAIAVTIANVRELAAIREQNARLRDDNGRLLQWQSIAQRLEVENRSLKALLALIPEPTANFVSARVVGDTGGTFAQSVLITAGTGDGVGKGNVVMTGEGLVGRVMQAGTRSARVLLITDINSRIPVVVGEAGNRAILVGDNGLRPRLLYVGAKTVVVPGDKVTTSGDAEAFPPGLPVGRVARVQDVIVEIEPYFSRDKLQHVRVVDYGLSGILATPSPPSGPKK